MALFAYDSSFHELNSLYDEWIDQYDEAKAGTAGLMVGYATAQGQRMQHAINRILEDAREGLFTLDGDETAMAHFDNAVLETNRGGWQMLAKEKDSLKIDTAVTATFGYDLIAMARELIAERPKAPEMYVGFS